LRTLRNSISATELARSLAWAAALLGALGPLEGGCGGGSPSSLGTEEAATIARAHQAELESFERWVRRVAAADTTFASRGALEEAAFAPVRGESAVLGAWVAREGPDAWALAHPARALLPEHVSWRRARLGGLSDLEVAADETRVFVRARSQTTGGAMLVVTMAFARGERER
jgi:hypothetical protein